MLDTLTADKISVVLGHLEQVLKPRQFLVDVFALDWLILLRLLVGAV